jgi:hypothetical protein
MTWLRSTLVLFVALILSVSFAVPAENVPETAYDESESLPCESAPVVSLTAPEISAKAVEPRASRPLLESSSKPSTPSIDDKRRRTYRSTDFLTNLDHLLRC